jgi:NAD(P)H-dependent FMN reductase
MRRRGIESAFNRHRRSLLLKTAHVMGETRTLNIPVILGTSRKGRASVHAANLIADLLNRRAGVCSRVIDIASLPLPTDDAGEAIKHAAYADAITAADGLVIVSPEYNHSFPGLLKHTLDSCLREYIHKAVGLVGVSSGPFAGIRVVQSLLPVMRELGLVTIFWDINIGQVAKVFADDGRLLDEAFVRRSDRFIRELIWMSKVLRHGREQVTIDDEAAEAPKAVPCPECGTPMTHHADKVVPAASTESEVVIAAARACRGCGAQTATLTSTPAAEVP